MGMAANLATMMEADVTATVSDISAVLTYKRNATTGTASPIGAGDNIEPEGILATADAEFVAAASGFSEVPPVRAVVDLDGVKMYVESSVVDDAAVTLRLKRGP